MSDPPAHDWFPSSDEPDPVRAVQAAMRQSLPRKFYEAAGIEERDGAFHLSLDGRTAKTPARRPLAVPTRGLGEALAAEWQRQVEVIDPASMPVTRLVNSAIDGVAPRRADVAADIAKFAQSDLVCYRAAEPDRLVKAQADAWDPVLQWASDAHDARFVLSEGVIHVAQPAPALEAIRAAIEAIESPFALAALHVMTTLTGSALIALAHAAGRLDADESWRAAHVDELFQEKVWGEDEEAIARRRARETEFRAASEVFRLAGA